MILRGIPPKLEGKIRNVSALLAKYHSVFKLISHFIRYEALVAKYHSVFKLISHFIRYEALAIVVQDGAEDELTRMTYTNDKLLTLPSFSRLYDRVNLKKIRGVLVDPNYKISMQFIFEYISKRYNLFFLLKRFSHPKKGETLMYAIPFDKFRNCPMTGQAREILTSHFNSFSSERTTHNRILYF